MMTSRVHSSQLEYSSGDSPVGYRRVLEYSPLSPGEDEENKLVGATVVTTENPGRPNTVTISIESRRIKRTEVCRNYESFSVAINDLIYEIREWERQLRRLREWIEDSCTTEFGMPAAGEICQNQESQDE